MGAVKKKFMYVNRKAPYGSIYGLEALDVVLAGAAFEQEVCLVFLDDGVYQLKRGQDPSILGMKHYTRTFGALVDFEVEKIYVEEESMKIRGLKADDLLEIPLEDQSNAVRIISAQKLTQIMQQQDVVLQF